MRGPLRRLRRLARGEAGTATVEFVILFPAFIFAMVSAIEASVLMSRAALLDRGLDLAVRELRLNTGAPPSFEAFRARVCAHAALVPDCESRLQIELQPVDTATWALLAPEARCLDREGAITPLGDVNPSHYRTGTGHDLMMVRACLGVAPIVPHLGLAALLPRHAEGGFRLVAVSAFVQEPAALGAGA